jgi:DNA-binding NarL/FixJ family response regulator
VTLRILIADDSDDTRTFLRSAMLSRGWTVCGEAANGRQAVLLASQLKPDLVIMDLSMPMLTGLEATREIRRAMPGQPVILFTLHASPQLVTAAANVGVYKVVSKSDGLATLIDAIAKIAAGSHPSGGSRGDPGSGSHTPLPFAPITSSPDTQTSSKPGTPSVLPHEQPQVAASAPASEAGMIAEPDASEPSPSEPSSNEPAVGDPAADLPGSVSEPPSET